MFMPAKVSIFVVYFLSLASSTAWKPTALPDSSSVTPPCHAAKDKLGNLKISTLVNSSFLESPLFTGSCLTKIYNSTEEKITCRRKNSVDAQCVNESSTATLCHNNNFKINYFNHNNGSTTVYATGVKEFAVWLLRIKMFMRETGLDTWCSYNASLADNVMTKTSTTPKPTSKQPSTSLDNEMTKTSLTTKPTSKQPSTSHGAGTSGSVLTLFSSTVMSSSKSNPENKSVLIAVVTLIMLVFFIFIGVVFYICYYRK